MLRSNLIASFGLIALALTGCNNNASTTDSGTGAVDTGTGAVDTGTGAVDTGTGATDTGTGAVDTGVAGPTCEAYCTAVTTNCTGENRQYGTSDAVGMASCMAACSAFGWAAGTAADTSGDTLGCRVYHAGAAGTDAALHCPHAGPLGGGLCGASPCATFCAADHAVCASAYADVAACMTACEGFTDATSVTSPTSTGGDTLACRTYHLTAAAMTGGAATHCAHTAADGGGVCQ